jgi:hypothetical protein
MQGALTCSCTGGRWLETFRREPCFGFNWKVLFVILASCAVGCEAVRDDLSYDHPVEYVWSEPGTPGEFSLFEGVHWDPAISLSAAPLIMDAPFIENQDVLDLFTGPGVVGILAAHENAKRVLSLADSDVSLACARYNIASHALDSIVSVKRLPQDASLQLRTNERFDVILATLISDKFSVDDGAMQTRLKLVFAAIKDHLEPSGRAFVICHKTQMDPLKESAGEAGKTCVIVPDATGLWTTFEIK